MIDQVLYLFILAGEQYIADREVGNQSPVLVYHINHLQGLGLFPEAADMLQCLSDGKVGFYRYILGCHQSPDTLFGITKELRGFFQVFGAQQLHQLLGHFAG